jgi:ribosome-binding factor A
MTERLKRLQSLFLEEIAGFISKNYADKFEGVVTITGVKLTKDLRNAKVYYSVLGKNSEKYPKEEIFKGIKRELVAHLAKRLRLKRIPSLTFEFDNTASNAAKIEAILKKIKEGN